MIFLDAALPPGAPWWAWLLLGVLGLLSPVLVAWVTGRAAGRAAGADLAARIQTLETTEPADLKTTREAAETALALARAAGADATTAKDDLARHIADEKERRDTARTYAQERDRTIASMVDKLTDKLTENTTSLKVLEARFNSSQDAAGVSRRGR